jgi:hypothetical protein
MDDTFSADYADSLLFYEPYSQKYPSKLTRFLKLLDLLNVPHEKPKQVYGSELVIIGFMTDVVGLRISIPPEAKMKLLGTVQWFLNSERRTLSEFQHLTGYHNQGI